MRISLIIKKKLTLENIYFTAPDIHLSEENNFECFNSTKICCKFEEIKTSSGKCSLKFYSSEVKSYKENTEFQKYGLIQFSESGNYKNQSFVIKNCDFYLINILKQTKIYYHFLFGFFCTNCYLKINIENVVFDTIFINSGVFRTLYQNLNGVAVFKNCTIKNMNYFKIFNRIIYMYPIIMSFLEHNFFQGSLKKIIFENCVINNQFETYSHESFRYIDNIIFCDSNTNIEVSNSVFELIKYPFNSINNYFNSSFVNTKFYLKNFENFDPEYFIKATSNFIFTKNKIFCNNIGSYIFIKFFNSILGNITDLELQNCQLLQLISTDITNNKAKIFLNKIFFLNSSYKSNSNNALLNINSIKFLFAKNLFFENFHYSLIIYSYYSSEACITLENIQIKNIISSQISSHFLSFNKAKAIIKNLFFFNLKGNNNNNLIDFLNNCAIFNLTISNINSFKNIFNSENSIINSTLIVKNIFIENSEIFKIGNFINNYMMIVFSNIKFINNTMETFIYTSNFITTFVYEKISKNISLKKNSIYFNLEKNSNIYLKNSSLSNFLTKNINFEIFTANQNCKYFLENVLLTNFSFFNSKIFTIISRSKLNAKDIIIKNIEIFYESYLILSDFENFINFKNISIVDINFVSEIKFIISLSNIKNILQINIMLFLNNNFSCIKNFDFSRNNKIIFKNTIWKNIKTFYGGSIIEIFDNNYVIFYNSKFQDIELIGGSFFNFQKKNKIKFKNIIISRFISYNYQKGGFIRVTYLNKIDFKNFTINKFICFSKGGLIFILDSNLITIQNIQIDNFNENTLYFGGGVFFLDINNTILISDAIFSNITSKAPGTILFFFENNEIHLKNIVAYNIVSNSSILGGTFLCALISNKIIIENNLITKAFSGNFGGFLYVFENNFLILKNNTLIENSCYDANLYFYERNKIIIGNCRFYENFVNNSVYLLKSLKNNMFYLNKIEIKIKNIKQPFKNTTSILFFENSFVKLNEINIENTKIMKIYEISNSKIYILSMNLYNDIPNYLLYFTNSQLFLNKIEIRIFTSFLSVFFSTKSSIMIKNLKIIFKNYQKINKISVFSTQDYSEVYLSQLKFETFSVILENFNFFNLIQSILKIRNIYFRSLKLMTNSFIIYSNTSKITILQSFISFNQILQNKNKPSGIFYLENLENLYIFKSLFIQNQIKIFNFPIIYFLHFKYNLLFKNNFLFNKFDGNGTIYKFYVSNKNKYANSLLLKNNFYKNRAKKGGIFYLKLTEKTNFLNIKSNKFYKNSAKSKDNFDKGGIAYFFNDKNKILTSNSIILQISENKFYWNSAKIGALFYFENQRIRKSIYISKNNLFKNNFATFISNFESSDIEELTFFVQNKGNYIVTSLDMILLSNLEYNQNECFAIIAGSDYFKNFIFITEEKDFSLEKLKAKSVIFEDMHPFFNYKKLNNGLICIISAKSPILPLNNKIENTFYFNTKFSKKSLVLNLIFRPCDKGEMLTNKYECKNCPPNMYSFIKDNTNLYSQCNPCPSKVNCYGGNMLTPKPNYWRISNNSNNFLECFTKDTCLGDTSIYLNYTFYNKTLHSGRCKEGYTGILCRECDNNYGKIGKFQCFHCSNNAHIYNFIFGLILRFGFAFLIVYLSLQTSFGLATNENVRITMIRTLLVKSFSNHVYVLSIFTFLPSYFPEQLLEGITFIAGISSGFQESFSLDCFIKNQLFYFPMLYIQLLFAAFYPLILLLFSLIFHLFFQSKIYKKERISALSPSSLSLHKMKNEKIPIYWLLISTWMNIILLYYMDIMSVVFLMFSTINVGDNENKEIRLLTDLSIKFYDKKHLLMIYCICVPLILLIGIGYMIFIIVKLKSIFKNVSQNENENLFMYGVIYYPYKKKFYYWDLIILLRKVTVSLINLIFLNAAHGINISTLLLIFIVINVCVIIQEKYSPFDKKNLDCLNVIESLSLKTLLVSIYSVIFIVSTANEESSFTSIKIVFCILIAASANIYFLLTWMKIYFNSYYETVKEYIGMLQSSKIYEIFKRKTKVQPISNKKKISFFASKFDNFKIKSSFDNEVFSKIAMNKITQNEPSNLFSTKKSFLILQNNESQILKSKLLNEKNNNKDKDNIILTEFNKFSKKIQTQNFNNKNQKIYLKINNNKEGDYYENNKFKFKINQRKKIFKNDNLNEIFYKNSFYFDKLNFFFNSITFEKNGNFCFNIIFLDIVDFGKIKYKNDNYICHYYCKSIFKENIFVKINFLYIFVIIF